MNLAYFKASVPSPGLLPAMRFTLVYRGDLDPTGNQGNNVSVKKWKVRSHLEPQLRKLWDERADLDHLRKYPIFPKNGKGVWTQAHPEYPEAERVVPMEAGPHTIDLCAEIIRGAHRYLPLVRKSLAVTCSLRILFLRHEPVGHLFNNAPGDLDNRLKTLIDGLAIPQDGWAPEEAPSPTYCLLEDDKLVTGIEVQTAQLLSPETGTPREVELIVEVNVHVTHPRPFNIAFTGD